MTWEIFRVQPFVAQAAMVVTVAVPAFMVVVAAIAYGPGLFRK